MTASAPSVGACSGAARTTSPWSPDAHSSVLSLWSHGSVLSIASEGSVLSIGSIGSAGSIASIGSALSALSVGSWLSVGSALSAQSRWSVMSWRSTGGRMAAYARREHRGTARNAATALLLVGVAGAVLGATRPGRAGRSCRFVG